MPFINFIAYQYDKITSSSIFKPTLAPIIAAILTILAASIISELLLTHFSQYGHRGRGDIRQHITRQINISSEKPIVYNLGGSGMLRAIKEDFNLNSHFDDKYKFVNAAYSGQTVIESLAILKKSNIKSGDIVILHTSISRINRTYPYDYLLCSPYVQNIFYRDINSELSNINLNDYSVSPLCQLTIFSKWRSIRTHLKNIYKQNIFNNYSGIYPLPHDEKPKVLSDMRASISEKQKSKKFFDRWLRMNNSSSQEFSKIIIEVNAYLSQIGAKLLVLDLPQNVEWFQKNHPYMDKPFHDRYKAIFNKLSIHGIKYIDLRRHPLFDYSDFYDHQHMVEKGRDKFLPLYEKLLIHLMEHKSSEK